MKDKLETNTKHIRMIQETTQALWLNINLNV